MRSQLHTLLMILVVCMPGVTACSENGTGPGSKLDVIAPAQRMIEGDVMVLSVSTGGRPLASGDVSWSSSDPTTVQVSNGVARGVGAGVAFVRARAGSSRDSVELTVQFAQSATAGMAIRIAGNTSEVIRLRGAGMVLQPVGLSNQHLQLRASNSPFDASLPQAGMGDSLLFINSPGPVVIGSALLNPLIVEWPSFRFAENSGAFFRIRDSGTRIRFYTPVTPARLEVRTLDLPADAGNVAGLITGSISFEAAGVVADVNDQGESVLAPLADTTVRIYAEFATPIYRILTPRVSMSLTGGPDAGSVAGGGGAALNEGGLSIWLSGYPAGSGAAIAKIFQGSIWLPAPGVGATTLGAADASVLADSIGAQIAWARFSSMPLTDGQPGAELHAFSESGTMTITAYQAPTRTAFGRVEGEITAVLRYPPGASAQGTTTLQSRFMFPVNPLDGHPLDHPNALGAARSMLIGRGRQ